MLRRAAGTVGVLSLAGCGGRPDTDEPTEKETPPTEESDSTETAVPSPFDTVTELTETGFDPTGEEPISEAIADAASDGVLLSLPSGTFPIGEGLTLRGLDRFGIAGKDTTIVPSSETSGTVLFARGTGAVHISNLQFDLSAEDIGRRALDIRSPDDIVIRDVSVTGRLDGGRGPVRIDVTDPDGSGLIERLRLPDGSVADERVTGCYVGDGNRGDITFSDCEIVGFSDNGLYAEPNVGRMVVDGGYFANSGISNVRVPAGSVVRDVHIRCDDDSRGFDNMRGIRLNHSEPQVGEDPTVIENCRIEMLDLTYSDGGIVLSSALPSMIVRDTEMRIDADDVDGIWAKAPEAPLRDSESTLFVNCDGVTITGKGDNRFAIQIDGRGGSTLTGIDVSQSAANRNGIGFKQSHDNVIRDARVNVGGIPILLQEATVETIDTNVRPTEIESRPEED